MPKKKKRDPRVKVPKLKWKTKKMKRVVKNERVGKYKHGH